MNIRVEMTTAVTPEGCVGSSGECSSYVVSEETFRNLLGLEPEEAYKAVLHLGRKIERDELSQITEFVSRDGGWEGIRGSFETFGCHVVLQVSWADWATRNETEYWVRVQVHGEWTSIDQSDLLARERDKAPR